MTSADIDRYHAARWLLIAAASFSLSAVLDNPVWSVTASVIGIAATLGALARRPLSSIDPVTLSGLLGLVVLAVAGPQRMARFSVLSGSHSIWLVLSAATCLVALVPRSDAARKVTAILALGVMIVGSSMVLVPDWEPVLSSDIHRAHLAAAEAMTNGENPYSDAVMFTSGDPNKPESTVVEGYPYPPPVLASYGLAATFTDPRIISAASWALVGGGLAYLAMRKRRPQPIALGVLVLLATTPIWRMALFMSWTEPLSIALFGAAIMGIAKRRLWGWLVLGLALASKQYLVMLAPVVFLIPRGRSRSRGLVALAVAAAVTAFPAVFGPSDYIQSVVGNALDIGFRPDTQSLNGAIAGLGGDFQIATWVLVPVVALLYYGIWRWGIPMRLLTATGVLILAVGLVLSSAFPNYWLLVMSLTGFAALAATTDDEDRGRDLSHQPAGDVDIPIGAHQVAEDAVPGDD